MQGVHRQSGQAESSKRIVLSCWDVPRSVFIVEVGGNLSLGSVQLL